MAQKSLERVYNIPLRKEYQKVAHWQRTKKAVTAVRQFLSKHLKSKEIKLGKELNEQLWKHGIENPPHHIKVTVVKDEKGIVKAELFGVEKKETPTATTDKTAPQKSAAKKTQQKTEESAVATE